MEQSRSWKGASLPRVTIDNEPIELPDWLSDSLASIKTYLECLAMKKERVLWNLQVDGTTVNLADPRKATGAFRDIRAATISFGELSRRLIAAGRDKVIELRAAVDEAVLLVLINDWAIAEGLWHEWEPQLREPVLSLKALRELLAERFEHLFDDEPLAQQSEELELIFNEVDMLFERPEGERSLSDLVTFSEILEFTLLPWLARFQKAFDRIEASLNSAGRSETTS